MKFFYFLSILVLFNFNAFAQKGDDLFLEVKEMSASEIAIPPMVIGNCEKGCQDQTVSLNLSSFQVSHGSPSMRSNRIWMWSYNDIGEGVFANFNFVQGNKYCIEVSLKLTRENSGGAIDPNAVFNIRASNGLTHNPRASGGAPIPTAPSFENIYTGNYTTGGFPINQSVILKTTYSPSNSFSQMWFYPESPNLPQINFEIFNVTITEYVDCPCDINAEIEISNKENCNFQFSVNSNSSNARIIGYLWDFGDGHTSTQKNPNHTYTNSGSYVIKLTVYGIDKEGNCCSKDFEQKINVNECAIECGVKSSFIVKRKGWFFWRRYDFINTSSTNATSSVLAYEWYIDGNLVSTSKNFQNYRGGGKRVCLKVYAIDARGNCCSDEYCVKLRGRIINYNDLNHDLPINPVYTKK